MVRTNIYYPRANLESMIRIATIHLLLLIFLSGAAAQSGRRIASKPTPNLDSKTEATLGYSESRPQPRRIRPNLGRSDGPDVKAIATNNKKSSITANNPTADDGESEEVITVTTSLITIPVSVFDRNGIYISGLRQGDFTIFEDGREQEIAYFGVSDKPFKVVLLLDISPSTQYKIEEIQNAAIAFIDQLEPADQVLVAEFDRKVNVLTEFTNERDKLYKAIKKAEFGDGTSIYEAVDFSLRRRLNKIEGRKAIVIFTDGVDTTSKKANYDNTLDLAEESDSLIFPIYFNTYFEIGRQQSRFPFPTVQSPIGTTASEYALGREYLEELSAYTGGRVFRPDSNPGGLARAFEGIADELRRQYNIGYVPDNDGKPGQRKQIRIRVNRPDLIIRSRDSYIVGSPPTSQAEN